MIIIIHLSIWLPAFGVWLQCPVCDFTPIKQHCAFHTRVITDQA